MVSFYEKFYGSLEISNQLISVNLKKNVREQSFRVNSHDE